MTTNKRLPCTSDRYSAERPSLSRGNALSGDPECPQDRVERLGGLRTCSGSVAVHADVEVPVRKANACPMGPVHGQRGLADAGWPGQEHDWYTLTGRLCRQCVQLP